MNENKETVTVELPIEEVVEIVRLLRAESRCLIENGDVCPNVDVVLRAQLIVSARERIVSALEEISSLEIVPQEETPMVVLDDGLPNAVDRALDSIMGGDDGLTRYERPSLRELLGRQVEAKVAEARLSYAKELPLGFGLVPKPVDAADATGLPADVVDVTPQFMEENLNPEFYVEADEEGARVVRDNINWRRRWMGR